MLAEGWKKRKGNGQKEKKEDVNAHYLGVGHRGSNTGQNLERTSSLAKGKEAL